MRRTLIRLFLLACLCAALIHSEESPTVTVTGDIPTRLTLKVEDLAKMPRLKLSVPEHDGTKSEYEGVPLLEILKRAGAPMDKELRGKALASYILAKAHDGYQVIFTIAEVAPEFANEPIIVADKRDGRPMSGTLGPFRLVCANDKAGARSVRMLENLEIVRLLK